MYRWLGNRSLVQGQEFHVNHKPGMSNSTMLLTKKKPLSRIFKQIFSQNDMQVILPSTLELSGFNQNVSRSDHSTASADRHAEEVRRAVKIIRVV